MIDTFYSSFQSFKKALVRLLNIKDNFYSVTSFYLNDNGEFLIILYFLTIDI